MEKQKTDKKEMGTNKSGGRSVAYPSLDLRKAVELTSALIEKLGRGPYAREDAVRGLGYSSVSGASSRSVAALVHYGLLDREGNMYAVSSLADDIINPTDDSGQQRQEAIAKAASTPSLFGKLIDRYQGEPLPILLDNILMREGVNHKSSKEVVGIFKETLNYAGLIKEGVVSRYSEIFETNEVGSSESNPKDQSPTSPARQGVINNHSPSSAYIFSDSGEGWSLDIRSGAPLTVDAKKQLVDIADILQKINNSEEE